VGEQTLKRIQISFWVVISIIIGLLIGIGDPIMMFVSLTIITLLGLALLHPSIAIGIMLVIAPLRVLISTESPISFPIDIGQMSLALVLVSWMLYILRKGKLVVLKPSILWIGIAFFVTVTAITAFSAISLTSWLTEWLKWVQVLVVVFIIFNTAALHRWEWLVFGVVAAGLANALVGLYEFVGGSGAIHLLIEEITQWRVFRAFGTFGQPNPFGGFMGLVFPIAAMAALGYGYRLLKKPAHQQRIALVANVGFYSMAAAILLVALIASWSRGAWLSIFVSIGIMVIALPRRLFVSVGIIIGIGSLVLLLSASGRLPASITNRISTITNELSSTGDVRGVDVTPANYANVERLAHWQAAVNIATAYPFLGAGFGNYDAAYANYSLIYWEISLGHAHNYYLNVLSETGMIGLAVYITLFAIVFLSTWQVRKHPDFAIRAIGIGLIGSWTYLLMHSLTDNLYVNNLFLHIAVLFALAALLQKQLMNTSHG